MTGENAPVELKSCACPAIAVMRSLCRKNALRCLPWPAWPCVAAAARGRTAGRFG
ncbi:unnamed protein product [Mycetohabitans rhizoxinica HKI 454]|uniref:Uncharacterized protein n=1 Tax=Mycetohabitans rhizoxinica (strain DSM 19002 / CIP 109453 / HKI 454) TaxID=882378 RepID=E5ANT7_MYCRK|nr:unnamed protein product [Mycetohabitans rhizoxinica HKI 454]